MPTDMPENQGGKTIMFAPWPKPFDDDFKGHYGLDDCYLEIVDTRNTTGLARPQPAPRGEHPGEEKGEIRLQARAFSAAARRGSFEVAAQRRGPGGERAFSAGQSTPMVRNELGELFLPLEGLIDAGRRKNPRSRRNWRKSRPKSPRSSRNWPIRTSRIKFRRRFCGSTSSGSPTGKQAGTRKPRWRH